jgi:hypothetical protein
MGAEVVHDDPRHAGAAGRRLKLIGAGKGRFRGWLKGSSGHSCESGPVRFWVTVDSLTE